MVVRLVHATALALALALALPMQADDRAIRSKVPAVYPEIAKRMHISGTVHLSVTIDAEGKVTDVKTLTGNRMLGSAAEDAVRRWRFAPAAAESTIEIEVNFGGTQ
ncbi:MAG: energy transducer TonB [Terracidiphilus sp.]